MRSYLGYGAHEVETALIDRVVGGASGPAAGAESPCGFGGRRQEVGPGPASVSFTGDFDACLEQVLDQLRAVDVERAPAAAADDGPEDGAGEAGGPGLRPIPGRLVRGTHVYGLALLFHVAHFVQASIGGLPRYPLVSTPELADAGRRLCAVPWREMQSKYAEVDPNTPPNRIGGRCFDTALAVALVMRLGLGGGAAGGSTDPGGAAVSIEVTQRVADMDVDWTVGVAVNLLGRDGPAEFKSMIETGPGGDLVLGKFATIDD